MARKGLGAILREADLISEGQLQEALAAQKTFGERLASILVRQSALTEKFAVTYLGRQLGVPGVDLSRQEIDLDLLEVVPLQTCERDLVFPVKVQGTRLQLAMSEPTSQKLVSEVEFKTGVRVVPMIALEASIKNAIVEARRALKAGQKSIRPNVQKAGGLDGRAGADEGAVEVIELDPVVIEPMDDLEDLAIIESLTEGAPMPGTFTVSPTAPPPPPAVEHAQTILVVDDDENVRGLIEMILTSKRYRVITAGTGREALARVREALPDLVILDGMLPEVHGFEICRQLKTSERYRHIPVVMVSAVHTGWRFAADVKQTYGADEYVEKPFEHADLLRKVQALLSRDPVTASPDSETASRQHLKDGVVALKHGRLDQALAAFQAGLAIDQFSDLLHYYLAMTYEKKDMVFHAIDHYEKAIQINPSFYDAITSLANLYQKQEFWRKAVEMWELALSATKDESVRARIKEHLVSLL
ncbi:MAG TPA: response regulator [Vicinamibacteria bacterium]|nr:response regulator [Vicinamibacteria bacterium]